jgi:ribonuclease-3
VARAWVTRIAQPEIGAELAPAALKSPKSRLQEHTQRISGARPEYRLLEAVGPDHEKVFRVEVVVDGHSLGAGVGPSRRTAETNAAAEALEALEALALAERPAGATPGGSRQSKRSPSRHRATSPADGVGA